jgi:acyl-CoA thioester hydrolase
MSNESESDASGQKRHDSNTLHLGPPFVLSHVVVADEIDEYNHVNNAAYIRWLDRCAWAHSASLGISIQDCQRIDRGMAVRRSLIDYLAPAFLGDRVRIATWITHSNGKLRVTRRFEVSRESSGQTLLQASIEYVCLALSTGRPARMPPEFVQRYSPRSA